MNDDLLFFAKPGRGGQRLPYNDFNLGAYARSTDAHATRGIGAYYDPSDVAASWRIVRGSFMGTEAFDRLTQIIIAHNNAVLGSQDERIRNSILRFRGQLDVNGSDAHEWHAGATNLSTFWDSRANVRTFFIELNTIISKQAELWGVDRKVLAGVLLGNAINQTNTTISTQTQNVIAKKLGASKPYRMAPKAKQYMGSKRKGMKRKGGMKRKR